MVTLFWSDPHLGLTRSSHTTAESRERLRQAVLAQAKRVCSIQADKKACLGDLFDTFSNSEATLASVLPIVEECSWILAGNHDRSNRVGAVSSLDLLAELYPDKIVCERGDTTTYGEFRHGSDVRVRAVPHKLSQQAFEAALDVMQQKPFEGNPTTKVLCLHCNYASGFATQDAALNLTRERAQRLLEAYDYVLLGHEHPPRSAFDGRLQVLGNIHPTSFADIGDKYVWRLDGEGLEPDMVWDPRDHHCRLEWLDLLDAALSSDPESWARMQFIDIVGTAPAERMPEIAKAIQGLWKLAPDALMIRNSVQSEGLQIDQRELTRAMSVPERITHELEGSELLPLWQTYLSKLETKQ